MKAALLNGRALVIRSGMPAAAGTSSAANLRLGRNHEHITATGHFDVVAVCLPSSTTHPSLTTDGCGERETGVEPATSTLGRSRSAS
jgi:hypothetical protein